MGIKASITPRLLSRRQAAEYCGMPIARFEAACPVAPVSLGEGKSMERYDVRALDAWIDTLGTEPSRSSSHGWLGLVEERHASRPR